MKFDTTYWHSMDRQAAQNLEVSPSQIGITTPPMKDQVASLKARVFQGAQQVELGFWGKGKGSMTQGSTTPGMYGKEEREAMKQMAKVNKINLTTHASPSAGALSGMVGGRETFSEDARERTVDEVKRAVDFAADVAEGGSITVHTGEFPREIASNYKDFESYPEEKKRAVLYLIDKDTGEMINVIRKDQKIWAPEWETDQKTGEVVWERDPKTGEKLRRVPKWDTEKEEYVLKERDYDYYVEEATDWNEKNKAEIERNPSLKKMPEVEMFKDTMKMKANYAKAYGKQYEYGAGEYIKKKEKIEKALKIYEKIEAGVPEEEKWQLMRQIPGGVLDLVPPETKLPSKILKEQLREYNKYIEHHRDMGISQIEQAKDMEEKMNRAIPIESYALDKTKDSIAKLGVYALDKTNSQKLVKPLFISPENVFPEGGFGAHPQEIKRVILESREEMAKKLIDDRGFSKSQAEKAANDHIKATFDIGHAFTWKKFFKGKPEKFDDWLFEQVDDLNKSGVIGKVHISDNFGYFDEHTTPGEGDVPLKKFVEKMRKAGYKDPMVVEPAHQDYKAWTGAMRTLQSPVYKIDLTSKSWTDVEHSYFGKTHSPNYMVGEGVVPDVKEWTLWSGVPLE